MRDYISIGSTPADEPCAQVGADNYSKESLRECQVFIAQLRRQFGTEPMLSSLDIRSFPHDFGSYREVVCYYDSDDEESRSYAFRLEAEALASWDKDAMEQLSRIV